MLIAHSVDMTHPKQRDHLKTRSRLQRAIAAAMLLLTACTAADAPSSDRPGSETPSPAVSFPSPEGSGRFHETRIQVADGRRSYGLYTPDPAPVGEAPLVVLLHGPTGDLATALSNSGLAPLADRHGFWIALPQASHRTGLAAQWAVARDRQENEAETDVLSALGADSFADANWPFGDADVELIVAVVEDVKASHDLDDARIFVVGLQNGGYMAVRAICDHPERFAAAAELGAGPFVVRDCPASRPLPSFSVISDGVLEKVSRYASDAADRNGCRQTPERRRLAPDVEEVAYTGCDEEAEVVVHVLSGVAYPWPWPPTTSRLRFDDYWPAQALWDFLSAHPLP